MYTTKVKVHFSFVVKLNVCPVIVSQYYIFEAYLWLEKQEFYNLRRERMNEVSHLKNIIIFRR